MICEAMRLAAVGGHDIDRPYSIVLPHECDLRSIWREDGFRLVTAARQAANVAAVAISSPDKAGVAEGYLRSAYRRIAQ